MSTVPDRLPSWNPGATRTAIDGFLDVAEELPPEQRLACFDNDGTLWCERPTYVQVEFLADALRRELRRAPEIAERPERAAAIDGDPERIRAVGMDRVVGALVALYEGRTPERFRDEVREFVATAVHPTLGRPLGGLTYRPMLELIAELQRLGFTVAITTGDRELLEWSVSGSGPGLALLVDHDDADRELDYRGHAATIEQREPIEVVARNAGWTTLSMRDDWATVFAD